MKFCLFLLFALLCSTAHSESVSLSESQQKISAELPRVEKELKSLPTLLLPEQKHVMFCISNFFQTQVLPFLQMEEKDLTNDSLDRENKALTQSIGDLQQLASTEKVDVMAFIAESNNLLSALKTRFNKEKLCFTIEATQEKS
jgi:hypothetical protein